MLIVDPQGEPLELCAWLVWDDTGRCVVERPFRPNVRSAAMVLRADGWLELAWPPSEPTPNRPGIARPREDLVVVDLFQVDDPADLYESAQRVQGLIGVPTADAVEGD